MHGIYIFLEALKYRVSESYNDYDYIIHYLYLLLITRIKILSLVFRSVTATWDGRVVVTYFVRTPRVSRKLVFDGTVPRDLTDVTFLLWSSKQQNEIPSLKSPRGCGMNFDLTGCSQSIACLKLSTLPRCRLSAKSSRLWSQVWSARVI